MTQNESVPKWIAALDGGGSKIAAVLARVYPASQGAPEAVFRHAVPGTGSAAVANWPAAQVNLSSVFANLLKQASIGPDEVAHVVLMLAGAGRPDDVARTTTALARDSVFSRCRRLSVTSDMQPLLTYANALSPQIPTVVVIAGTGSLVASLDARGQVVRAGGWGPTLGDEGSGWGIALCALRAVCQMLDREGAASKSSKSTTSDLLKLIGAFALERNIIGNFDQLPSALIALANDRHLAAQLAPAILSRASQSTDSLEQQIVSQELSDLADQVMRVHQRIDAPKNTWRLALTGGLALNNQHFQDVLNKQLHQRKLSPSEVCLLDPLQAALSFAATT